MELDTSEFLLNLSPDWVEHPGDHQNQFMFWSEQKGSSIIVSCVFAEIPPDKREGMARAILDGAVQGHFNLGGAEIYNRYVDEIAELDHVYCGFDGHDQTGFFRRRGWVTPRKALNLWVHTETPRRRLCDAGLQ